MKPFLFQFILLQFLSILSSGQIIGETWTRYETPEDAGWSSNILEKTFRSSNAASMMLIYDGKVVSAYGEYWRRFKCHSIRKSILNSLYGIHVEKGTIDLGKSLSDLNIKDIVSLTESEKSATIKDLLTSRSGVYIPSGQETSDMKDSRPERGTHPPGTFYYYNNWDFNVLGTIFMQETG
ncbi:MAG: serine hydrolase, partial [Bacteroidales bacterium]